jgi:hypothetical protein
MKRSFLIALALLFTTGSILPESHASLAGPWRRYRSSELGFQIPYVDDWHITPLKNCVVFAMQLNPQPYVRLAVGRISAGSKPLVVSVREKLAGTGQSHLKLSRCRFAGSPAVRVEGLTDGGRMLDYYVDRGAHRYWISIIADRPESWDDYAESFEIILNDFRFL